MIDIMQPMRIGEGSPRLGGRDCNKHKRACRTLPILCDTAVFAQGLLSLMTGSASTVRMPRFRGSGFYVLIAHLMDHI